MTARMTGPSTGAGAAFYRFTMTRGAQDNRRRRWCYGTAMPRPKPDQTDTRVSPDGPTGTTTVVETACPLDCPDSCSLSVTVQRGRVIGLDGSRRNPVTDGFICAKVRRFDQRVYGPDRLRYPAVRKGRKGQGEFARVSWDEALQLVADRLSSTKAQWGGTAILPYAYGGSNGMLSHQAIDATLWRRLGASRLARTLCAAPTGAASQALYGKMPSVSYQDYPSAALIIVWGFNASTSGIHLVPFLRDAQKRGATLVVIDPRATPLARSADIHLPIRPGTDVAVALAIHRVLFEEGGADHAFLAAHTHGAEHLRARAAEWTIDRAAAVAGIEPSSLARVAQLYATRSPAIIRCGWGLERNRNGGNAALSVLALPAVGGKFGVRGGGYSMSNSSSWNLEPSWIGAPEADTRVVNMNHLGRILTEPVPSVRALFVYNCNPAVTVPDQRRVLEGLGRSEIFTVVFDQVMTDTALFADVVLPATTFLEGYDFARAYGPINLDLVRPAIEPVGEARSNADVFGELATRLGLLGPDDPAGELDLLVKVLDALPGTIGADVRDGRLPAPSFGVTPIQFVDVFPNTPDQRVNLFPEALERETSGGLYRFVPDPATAEHPLTLISPASDRTISSTLGELPRADAVLSMNPEDARARALEDGDAVRVFNTLGEVHCTLKIAPTLRVGVVSLPKGLWRRSTRNSTTSNALVPDTLTDFAGGACFNDARVQVTSLPNA